MSESQEWMAEHKGRYLKTVGYIWECGDDDCRCEQAVIVDYFENKVDHRFRVPVNAWRGTFTTWEGRVEGGIDPDAELVARRRHLRETDPEREAAIEWQRGIDYDA